MEEKPVSSHQRAKKKEQYTCYNPEWANFEWIWPTETASAYNADYTFIT